MSRPKKSSDVKYFPQGALGRDWYIMDRFAKDRKAYQKMIFDIATLLSGPNAKPEEIQKDIDSLLKFEIEIIKVSLDISRSGVRPLNELIADKRSLVPERSPGSGTIRLLGSLQENELAELHGPRSCGENLVGPSDDVADMLHRFSPLRDLSTLGYMIPVSSNRSPCSSTSRFISTKCSKGSRSSYRTRNRPLFTRTKLLKLSLQSWSEPIAARSKTTLSGK